MREFAWGILTSSRLPARVTRAPPPGLCVASAGSAGSAGSPGSALNPYHASAILEKKSSFLEANRTLASANLEKKVPKTGIIDARLDF